LRKLVRSSTHSQSLLLFLESSLTPFKESLSTQIKQGLFPESNLGFAFTFSFICFNLVDGS